MLPVGAGVQPRRVRAHLPGGGRTGPAGVPPVLAGRGRSSLAFAALFHLFGAAVRRPTVVALVYSFFLETILGDMPGLLKRVSVTFYTRCLMFDAAGRIWPDAGTAAVYQPVDGTTAWVVLVGGTVCLLLAGMWWFSRTEYRDDG